MYNNDSMTDWLTHLIMGGLLAWHVEYWVDGWTTDSLVHDSFLPVGSLQSSAPACPPPPPPPHLPPPLNPPPCMNVLPECFSCFTIVKRVRESAGSRRDGGWGERESMCAHETKRGGGGGCFSVVIILIT